MRHILGPRPAELPLASAVEKIAANREQPKGVARARNSGRQALQDRCKWPLKTQLIRASGLCVNFLFYYLCSKVRINAGATFASGSFRRARIFAAPFAGRNSAKSSIRATMPGCSCPTGKFKGRYPRKQSSTSPKYKIAFQPIGPYLIISSIYFSPTPNFNKGRP